MNNIVVNIFDIEQSIWTVYIIIATWKDIKIKFDDIDINIADNISLIFTKKQDGLFLIGAGKLINNIDYGNVYTFSDLMPNTPMKEYIKKFITIANINKIKPEYIQNFYKCTVDQNYFTGPVNIYDNINKASRGDYELYIILLLKTCCSNLNIITSYFEFMLFISRMNIALPGVYSIIREYIMKTMSINFFGNIMQFDKDHVLNIPDPNVYGTKYNNLIITNINLDCGNCDVSYLNAYTVWFSEIKRNMNGKSACLDGGSNKELDIYVTSSNNTISNQFSNLMSIINSNTREKTNHRNKIKIFNVNIYRENVIEEIDNPIYYEYMEKYNLISNIGKTNNDSSKENNKGDTNKISIDTNRPMDNHMNNHMMDIMIHDYYSNPIPPKKIKNESIRKSVQCDYINDKNKSFDTLYLREKDTRRLKFALENFHERSEILDVLGLPNKLGILLHGEPGTGKTSTIWAIATYLNKDIYYVNLNTIETNEELQMVFDYINKNCINGGIITFEDIDAMTDVINKRSNSSDNTENIVILMQNKKSKLTLEYFLNLLQGTLTQDGTTFIVTTNHLDKLDPAFYRDGRFDVKIEMKKCDRYQIQKIYEKFIKRKLKEELLHKLPEDVYTPANIIFHLKDYILDEYSDEEIIGPLLHIHN